MSPAAVPLECSKNEGVSLLAQEWALRRGHEALARRLEQEAVARNIAATAAFHNQFDKKVGRGHFAADEPPLVAKGEEDAPRAGGGDETGEEETPPHDKKRLRRRRTSTIIGCTAASG